MGRLIEDNLGFFGGLIFLIIDSVITISVLQGDFGITEKIICVAVVIIIFFWTLPRFFNLMTDIMTPKAFQGRNICVDGRGGYEMMQIAAVLSRYLAEKGAIIVDDEDSAEFQVILSPDIMNPLALSCTLIDPAGYRETSQELPFHWPRPTALKISTFIRRSGS